MVWTKAKAAKKTTCAALAACAIMALAGCTPGGAGPGAGGAPDGDAAASGTAVASGGALSQGGAGSGWDAPAGRVSSQGIAAAPGGGPIQPGQGPMPMEARRGEEWDTIRYMAGLIGKTPGEMDEFSYYWMPGYEYIIDHSGLRDYLFSDIDGVATCVAAGMDVARLLPYRIVQPITAEGLEAGWGCTSRRMAGGPYVFGLGGLDVYIAADGPEGIQARSAVVAALDAGLPPGDPIILFEELKPRQLQGFSDTQGVFGPITQYAYMQAGR